MAKDYKKLYEERYGGTAQSDKLQNQINNYKARLEAGGVDSTTVENAGDDRNAIERWLNLDQNQGLIGDVFELMGRPQQAIFGGIKNAQEGGDFFEGFGEGFTGEQDTQFKDILMNTGAFDDTKGKLNLVDLLGYAGDVLLDPADLIPVAGWAKAADTLADTGSLLKAYKATDSLSDLAFKTAGKAVKGGAKIADKGIEAGLKTYDATRGVRNSAGDLVRLGYETPNMKSAANLRPYLLDATQDMKGAKGTFQTYKGIKEGFNNIFNVSDAAKKAERLRREVSSSAETATEASALKIREMQKAAQEFSEKTGGKYGDANQLLNDARMMLESVINRTLTEEEVLSKALSGDMPGYPEVVEHLNKMLNRDTSKKVRNEIKQRLGKNALDIEVTKTGKINLGKGWKELEFSSAEETGKLLNKQHRSLKSAADELDNYIQSSYIYSDYVPFYPSDSLKKYSKRLGFNLDDPDARLEDLYVKLTDELTKLDNQILNNSNRTIRFNRNYTPEQAKYLEDISERYSYNVDGFRDFVHSIFGTDWRKQDSDILSSSIFFNNPKIYHTKNLGFDSEPLTKTQSLLLEPTEHYAGRSTVRTEMHPIDPSNGKLNTNANTQWLSRSPDTAYSYATGGVAGRTPEIASISNIGKKPDSGTIYRGLLTKTDPENVVTISPHGKRGLDGSVNKSDYISGKYETQHANSINYKDYDTYNAFDKLNEEDVKELLGIFDMSKDGEEFEKILKSDGSERLKNNLKNAKIDINSLDRPSLRAPQTNRDSARGISNVDVSNLYQTIEATAWERDVYATYYGEPINEFSETFKGQLALNFLPDKQKVSHQYSDEVSENIWKNDTTGRSTHPSNTIVIENIGQPDTASHVILHDTVDGIRPRRFKSLDNKTPLGETADIFDEAENAKEAIRGGVNLYNDFVDEFLGTGLGGQYANTDYVMGHTLTKEGKSLSDAFKKFNNERVSKGNSSLLNSRKYVGSVEETNNYIRDVVNKIPDDELKDYPEILEFKHNKDAKFVEPDFAKSITNSYADYFGVTGLARDTKVVSDTLLNDTFSNYDELVKVQNDLNIASKSGKSTDELANKYTKLINDAAIKPLSNADNNIPKGFTVLSGNELADYINKYVKINGQLGNTNTAKQLKKLANKVIKNGNDVAINSDVLRIIGFASDKKTTSELSDLYSTYLNFFKKWKTASPTNFLNNLIGNSSNLALGGVSVTDQARLGPKVLDIMQNGKKYHLQRLAGEVLDDSANEIADLWEQYRKMGFGDASLDLADLPEDLRDIIKGTKKLNGPIDYAKDGLPALFGYLNQKGDNVSRLTIMLKSMEDPSFLKRLGATDAYDAISKIMFDPTMLTSSEKKIKQVIPFYSYAKNNLVYQVANMQNNGHKYNQLMKGMKSLQKAATDGNEENMADYLKSSLYIPIPGIGEDGKYTMLRASLPFGQLIEAVDDPFQALTNSLSPMIKAPVEYATGIDSFTGREIESFPGEKSSQIPFLTKKQQKFLSDFTGLDVPLKYGNRFIEGLNSENGSIGQGLKNMIMMENSIDTDKISRQYTEIEELQNMLKQYEQEGYEFSTITELKKANKNNTVAGLDALFAKYGIE